MGSTAGALHAALTIAVSQVDQGETQIINVRESDGRLGPLVFMLVALGCATLAATIVFWFLTRPNRTTSSTPVGEPRPEGDR